MDVAGSGVRVQLLGGFQIAGGQVVIEPSTWRLRKAGHLVKLLALAPNQRLHREQILEALWPNLPRGAASNNLRVTLHFARKQFDQGYGATALALQGEHLVLFPDTKMAVDVESFETAAAPARDSDAVEDVRAALALYPGELLPEDRLEEWSFERRDELHATHLELLNRLALLYEQAGEHELAIGTLRRIIAADHLNETAYLKLMWQLSRAGRRAQALRVYQQLRENLQDELDVEPDPATTRAYEEILTGGRAGPAARADDLAPSPTARQPAAQGASARSSERRMNLPARLTSFVGRQPELTAIGAALREARLLTLIGPGGSGKTRLAIEVASSFGSDYPDGVWLAELAGINDPALAPQTVAAALSVREVPGQPALETLVAQLHDRNLLLLLDNCEHLIDACASLAEALLTACPHLTILATSREALRIEGETLRPVAGLATPDAGGSRTLDALHAIEAVQLFCDRARRVRPDFELRAENAGHIVTICRALEGMPLAIELSATRMRALSVAQIARRLGDTLRLLSDKGRGGPERMRSMRAAIGWSYELLSAEERRLLQRLAVFSGGFSFEAAEAICADELIPAEHVLEFLFQLSDKSLVVVDEVDGEARYRLLEPIRQYALELLEMDGEFERWRGRHAQFFREIVETAEPYLIRAEQRYWLQHLLVEHDNIRLALSWHQFQGDTRPGFRMAAALVWFWWDYGYLAEGRAACEALLALPDPDPLSEERARLLSCAAVLAQWEGDFPAALAQHDEALAQWKQFPDQHGAALSLLSLGIIAMHQGQFKRAQGVLEQGLALYERAADDPYRAMLLDGLARSTLYQGDRERAISLWEESLDLASRLHDQGTESHVLISLGGEGYAATAPERAGALLERGLALARVLEQNRPLERGLRWLGMLALQRRADREGAQHFREALGAAREVNDPVAVAAAIEGLACVAAMIGDTRRAAYLYGAVAGARRSLGVPLTTPDPWDIEERMDAVRLALGEPHYTRAWEAGQALTLEQAIAEALAPEPERT